MKNTLLLCAVCTAIFTKGERIRSFSLGGAAGILLVELAESLDHARRANAEGLSEK